jgi:hypothetical protein
MSSDVTGKRSNSGWTVGFKPSTNVSVLSIKPFRQQRASLNK